MNNTMANPYIHMTNWIPKYEVQKRPHFFQKNLLKQQGIYTSL